MAKRRADLINTDLFSDTSSVDVNTSEPVTPAPKFAKKNARKSANKLAKKPVDRLTGQDRTFSSYLDEGLVLEIDQARTEVRRITGRRPHQASKRMIVEAAIIQMLDDLWANGENSFVVQYISDK